MSYRNEHGLEVNKKLMPHHFKDWVFLDDINQTLAQLLRSAAALAVNEAIDSIQIWWGGKPGKINIVMLESLSTEIEVKLDVRKDFVRLFFWEDPDACKSWARYFRNIASELDKRAKNIEGDVR